MIGPQGVRGPETGFDPAKVSAVEGSMSGVCVTIAAAEDMFFTAARWLSVRFENGVHLDRNPVVYIYGGNTNDGSIERYEEAARAYEDAIKIGKFMREFMTDPDDQWGDYRDYEGDDILKGLIVGQPDWILCIYLSLAGEDFHYGRDYEPSPDVPDIYSLDMLRSRVEEIARARVEA